MNQPIWRTRISTGVPGFDEVLLGGLIPRRAYLVRGGPGTGKTILGLHFLAATQQSSLFVTMGEAEPEIRKNAAALGFDLGSVQFLDLSPSANIFTEQQNYDIFTAAEVERDPTVKQIAARVDEVRPERVFFDGMTQLRYLFQDAHQFRKQVLALLRYLTDRGATVMFTSESNETPDEDLQFLCDGAIQLNASGEGRSLQVIKFRGSDFRSGRHSARITDTGMEVFPRLIPADYGASFSPDPLSSGLPELDTLLNGGIERGTISLLTGPSGVGKSSLGIQFMKQAAQRGERSVVYLFEEWAQTLIHRCESIGIPVSEMLSGGNLSLVQVEPLRFTHDQFACMVRQEVEDRKARIVMIDSIAGYRLSLRGEDLVSQMHALCKYLQNMGVAVLLVNEVEAITGDFRVTEVGVSYMADNIIFLRYIEMHGEMRKALGVLKKRLSDFEKTLRELTITGAGIHVGQPLTGLRGILRGEPQVTDPFHGEP